MKKLFFIFYVFLTFSILVFGDDISEYPITLVKEITAGQGDGHIGWEKSVAGSPTGPSCFLITDDYIYIPDRVNYRLNVYDIAYEYQKAIIEKGKKKIQYTKSLKIDDYGNFVYYTSSGGLRKIDDSGNTIFSIDKKSLKQNDLYKELNFKRNFFLIDNDIFLYNDNNEIQYINKSGEIESAEKAVARLIELSEDNTLSRSVHSNTSLLSAEATKTIESLRNSKRYLIAENIFYSTNFFDNKDYFERIENISTSSNRTTLAAEETKNIDLSNNTFYKFVGYDKESNSYWEVERRVGPEEMMQFILIYSKFGEILDALYFGEYKEKVKCYTNYPTSGAVPAISPSGDVYFMVGTEEKYSFYKIERQW